MANEQNLVPWKPGQSGNPGGRPKGRRSITAELVRALEKKVLVGQPVPMGMDAAEFLGEAILYYAGQGDAAFARMAIDRTDGPVPEPVEIKTEGTASEAAQKLDAARQRKADRDRGPDSGSSA